MTDLISRKALLEALEPEDMRKARLFENGEYHLDTLAEGFTSAHLLIESSPAVEAEPKWIPATERLPEDDLPKDSKVKRIKVLVAYKTNGRWVTRTQIRAKGYWYGASDKWSWVKTSDPITHWMPLPEPPKGD